MHLRVIPRRPDWQSRVEKDGLPFHTVDGDEYWAEGRAYEFTVAEADDIKRVSEELHAMACDLVGEVVQSEELMSRFAFPQRHWNMIAESWRAERNRGLGGRFDLAIDAAGTPKLIEYNAEIAGMLVESSAVQASWVRDQVELGHLDPEAYQFNRIGDDLTDQFGELFLAESDVHFTCAPFEEDYAHTEYLGYRLLESGSTPHFVEIQDIGIDDQGRFADQEGRVIQNLVKFYAWDFMLFDEFCEAIPTSCCNLIEPAWKAILSSKALLPLLWERHEGHPNLLRTTFLDQKASFHDRHFVKPLFGRNGGSIEARDGKRRIEMSEETYMPDEAAGHIVQEAVDLPLFDGPGDVPVGALSSARRAMIGAWIIGDTCSGMSVTENDGLIGGEERTFSPHFILDR